ncbi:MAG: PrsW family intramembrane metalloprotease [Ignavibacteriaceae bacterium]|nr:PrsW family intramembrane metalloprotease [Ignavibacteriaceae bacterium]
MLIISSALAAIVPMTIYLILIWRFDRYDREPFKMVLNNYLWGAVGAVVLTLLVSGSFSAFISFFITDANNLQRFETIIIAPVVEEIIKGAFLLITAASFKFDNMTDGIVYGGAIGLGFGMTENFLYFISYGSSIEQWVTLVIVRTLFSAVMHCVSTATLGAFIGYAKFKKRIIKYTFPFIGLFIAMFIHFSWNFSVSSESTAFIGFFFMFCTIAIFITVFSASVYSERKIIFDELIEEVESGLIPHEHLLLLNSAKRNIPGWIDESVRKLYIRSATTLAFRKMQIKSSSGKSREYYETEIENYRNFIKNLTADS